MPMPMKKDDEPKMCPFCGCTELHTFVEEWSAESDDDPSNTANLNEHQCERCGAAFWT